MWVIFQKHAEEVLRATAEPGSSDNLITDPDVVFTKTAERDLINLKHELSSMKSDMSDLLKIVSNQMLPFTDVNRSPSNKNTEVSAGEEPQVNQGDRDPPDLTS